MKQLNKYLPEGWYIGFYSPIGYYYLNIKGVVPNSVVATYDNNNWEFKKHITEEFRDFVLERLIAAENALQEKSKNSQLEVMRNAKFK